MLGLKGTVIVIATLRGEIHKRIAWLLWHTYICFFLCKWVSLQKKWKWLLSSELVVTEAHLFIYYLESHPDFPVIMAAGMSVNIIVTLLLLLLLLSRHLKVVMPWTSSSLWWSSRCTSKATYWNFDRDSNKVQVMHNAWCYHRLQSILYPWTH